MNPKSAQQKGKRFEDFIANEITQAGFGKARREIGSGSGKYKGDIFSDIDFMIECKNHAKLNWWESIDQAKQQAIAGNFNRWKWVLVARDPRTPESNPDVYAVIDFWQFLDLLKREKEPIIKEPDKEMKWMLQRLVDSAKQIIKRLEK
jgi:Holliday junction resolvase